MHCQCGEGQWEIRLGSVAPFRPFHSFTAGRPLSDVLTQNALHSLLPLHTIYLNQNRINVEVGLVLKRADHSAYIHLGRRPC